MLIFEVISLLRSAIKSTDEDCIVIDRELAEAILDLLRQYRTGGA